MHLFVHICNWLHCHFLFLHNHQGQQNVLHCIFAESSVTRCKAASYVCMEKKIASSSLIAFMSYFARTKLVLLE